MKKIKAFFYIAYKSLTSAEYYKDILKTKLSFSIKYIASLALIATLITTAVNLITELPKVDRTLDKGITKVKEMYPEGFEITMDNGNWYINKEEPFNISFPESMKEEGMPANLIVFYKEGTIEDVSNFSTLMLVNKVNILVQGSNKLEVYPIRDIPNGTFTQREFDFFITSLEGFTKYVPAFYVVFTIFFSFIYYFVFRLMYLLFVGSVVMLLSLFTKVNLSFKDSFRVSLHTMTFPFLIDTITRSVSYTIPIGGWFFILNVLFATLVLSYFIKTRKKN